MAVTEPENLDNLFSLYRLAGSTCENTMLHPSGSYTIIQAGGSAWPNMAFGVDEARFGTQLIESIATEMSALGLRPAVLLNYEPAWTGILRSAGFYPVDQWLGMSCSGIGTGISAIRTHAENAYIIEEDDDIRQWTEVVSETLFDHKPMDNNIFRALHAKGTELVGIRIEGELAGSSMIYFDEKGVAGIYMVGIKEKFRGKGLGKELIRYCLGRIKKRGIDRCYLQSTRMGIGLYKAMDFRESDKYLIFCKIK